MGQKNLERPVADELFNITLKNHSSCCCWLRFNLQALKLAFFVERLPDHTLVRFGL